MSIKPRFGMEQDVLLVCGKPIPRGGAMMRNHRLFIVSMTSVTVAVLVSFILAGCSDQPSKNSVGKSTAAISGIAPWQDMAIPAYFYPGPLWDQATAQAPTVDIMIMNPASGPGTAVDPNYVMAVNNAVNAGITVMGYVHTSYGARSLSTVKAEILKYLQWYDVNDIFLDEAATTTDQLAYYQNLATYIHNRSGIVMLNHGTVPAEQYVNVGDIRSNL